MPRDITLYSKLIFITYNRDDEQAKNFAVWLYQRLKYLNFPVQTYGADEAIGGSGFGEERIKVTEPLIVIFSSSAGGYQRVSEDIKIAQKLGKEIYLVIYQEVEFPLGYTEFTLFDFRLAREQMFQHLSAALGEKEYPESFQSRSQYDSGAALEHAHHALEYFAGSDSFKFYRDYYYLKIFSDTSPYSQTKVVAVRDLGRLKALNGLLLAVLSDDPSEDARAEAALALTKFENENFVLPLQRSARNDSSGKVRAYAEIALLYLNSQSFSRDYAIRDIISTLQEAFEITELITGTQQGNDSKLETSTNKYAVFISYARRDTEEYAIDLAKRLELEGVQVWIDTQLQPGTPRWTKEIENALIQSSFILVLISPAIHDSEWVLREVSFAQEHGIKIVPIRVLETWRPLYLQGIQGLRGEPLYSDEPEKVLQLVMELIKSDVGALG